MSPEKIEWFYNQADLYAEQSTCPKLKVGAVVVDPLGIPIGFGFNGSPRYRPHCEDVGCKIVGKHCVRTVHAEVNAICHALRTCHGNLLLDNCSIFVSHTPCQNCLNLIMNMMVSKLYFRRWYPKPFDLEKENFQRCGLGLLQVFNENNFISTI